MTPDEDHLADSMLERNPLLMDSMLKRNPLPGSAVRGVLPEWSVPLPKFVVEGLDWNSSKNDIGCIKIEGYPPRKASVRRITEMYESDRKVFTLLFELDGIRMLANADVFK